MSATVTLNGEQVLIPKDFFDVTVKASFNENVQANLTTEEFTFILDGYEKINKWISDGLNGGVGIFEGMPMTISKSNVFNNETVFTGILDLQAGAVIKENLKEVDVRIRQDNNLNSLSELIEPLDFGYLKDIGRITSSDYVNIDYVVNEIDKGVKTITTFIVIYLLSKQLADSIKEIAETAAIISGISASGVPGPLGATIYAVATAIAQVAYAATLLVLIVNFGIDLFNILVQPQRTHKGIKWKTLLEKTCEEIGYNFETTIEDLDNLVYLPSNQNVDEFGLKGVFTKVASITEGIPNPADAGYSCTDFFEISRELFNARFAVVNDTVQFHTESSSYWLADSGWEKPQEIRNVAEKSYRRNTDEINSSIRISFQTDLIDEYTIRNYKGTSFQVLTDAKTVQNPRNKTIKNVDLVNVPLALANRKDSLNPFEQSLVPLANLFDSIAGVFGGRPNLAKKIKSKVGVLEVSNNNHSVPKAIWIQGDRIPSNHRDLFSAKTLWDKYHVEKSFVQNGFSRQRRYVEGETIPFGLNDFVTLLNNSYFRDSNGTNSKVVDIEWNMSKDFATISYWTQEVYTNNLKETFIEPS